MTADRIGRGRWSTWGAKLFASCAAILLCGVAHAATISDIELLNNGGAFYSVPDSGTFTLAQFDDLGGTRILNSVTLDILADFYGGQHDFDNESGVGGTATVTIGVDVKIIAPSTVVLHGEPLKSASGTITADTDGSPDWAGTDNITVLGPPSSAVIYDADAETIFSGFAPYMGTGTFTLTWDAITNTSVSSSTVPGGSHRVLSGSIRYEFSVKVTYDYTLVPEPGGILLAAFGLPVLAGASIRRKARRRRA